MATTTPNYGWDVPTSTDYVKDGALAIETLGDDIDASLFSITGGKNVGLQYINGATFTAATTVTLDNVFTSAYINYRVVFESTVSSSANKTISLQFRAGGSTINAANYNTCTDGAIYGGGTSKTNYFYSANNVTALNIIDNAYYTNTTHSFNVDVINPQIAKTTNVAGQFAGQTAANLVTGGFNGVYGVTTVFDGFIISCSSGNMTGTVKVYGYRN